MPRSSRVLPFVLSALSVPVLFIGLTATPADTSPQQVRDARQQGNTGQLAGRVVARDTGRPVRGALVYVRNSAVPSASQGLVTDSDGLYQAKGLPAGKYTVRVEKTGFVTWYFGQSRVSQPVTEIELAAGASINDIDIKLPRAGVIAGRILDEFGEPISRVPVNALTYRYSNGERRLVSASSDGAAITNDLGEYRLYGLPAGDYYISTSWVQLATPIASRGTRYVPVFYPGTTTEAAAQRIVLSQGQQVAEVNFTLQPVPVAAVSGHVNDASGQPISSGVVNLVGGTSLISPGAAVQPSGDFTITLVPPGDYMLVYGPHGSRINGPTLTPAERDMVNAPMPLTVSGQDISNVVVALSRGTRVSGRLMFDGPVERTLKPSNFIVTAAPLVPGIGGVSASRVTDSGDFSIDALTGQQTFRIGAGNSPVPPTVALKAVRVSGQDITDQGVDLSGREEVSNIQVVLTTRISQVSGTVLDDAKPAANCDVLVFSANAARWGYRTRYVGRAHADRDGRFLVRGLPPDDYLVVAVPFLEVGDETDPQRLEHLRPFAVPMPLGDAETKTITLRLTPG